MPGTFPASTPPSRVRTVDLVPLGIQAPGPAPRLTEWRADGHSPMTPSLLIICMVARSILIFWKLEKPAAV